MLLSLDIVRFAKKPTKNDIGKINNRISQGVVSLDIEEIANEIACNGCSFCPAVFNGGRKKSFFQQAQLIGLDFDKGITFPEVLDRCKEYDLNIAFAYETFSSTEENQKFRVVFCLDGIIRYTNIYELLVCLLLKIFPEADPACKDCSRIFFGSNKGILFQSDEICSIPSIIRGGEIKMGFGNHNYSRQIKNLAKKYGVCVDGGHVKIKECKNEEISTNSYTIYKAVGDNSSFYEFPKISEEEVTEGHDNNTQKHQNRSHKKHRNIISKMASSCYVLKRLTDKDTDSICFFEEMTHDEHVLLMSNLIHVDGGKSFFMDLVEKSGSDLNKWKRDWSWWEASGEGIYTCANHCKYCNKCNHSRTIIDTALQKIKIITKDDYCTLAEASEDIKMQFAEAMDNPMKSGNKIHLVKAQAGIGKTRVYTEYIVDRIVKGQLKADKKILIAVPTNALKKEVEDRILELEPSLEENILVSVGLEELPQLPYDIDELKYYYEIGFPKEVLKKIEEVMGDEDDPDGDDPVIDKYRRFISFNKMVDYSYNKIIITTHSRLLQMKKEQLENCEIIIDEDILKSMMKQAKVINHVDLQHLLLYEKLSEETIELFKKLKKIPDGKCIFVSGRCKDIKRRMLEKNSIQSNFKDLTFDSLIIRSNDCYRYITPEKFDWGTNVVILSATADEEIYRCYFGDDRFVVHKSRKAVYMGGVKQYTKYSLNRNKIRKIGRKFIKKKIEETIGKYPVITFKEFKKKSCPLNFGKTEGFDIYNGQTIAVVGTPYPHPDEVTFWYYLLKHDNPDQECNLYINQYGSYRFCSYCYKDELMRRIQTYLIISELEQAVGRARLLRNNCTVYVFSNYPVEQAQFCDEPYLEDKT